MLSLKILSRGEVVAMVLLLIGVKLEVLKSSCFNTVKDRGAASLSRASLREAIVDCWGKGAELRASNNRETDASASKCSIHWLKSIVKFSGYVDVSEEELEDLEC